METQQVLLNTGFFIDNVYLQEYVQLINSASVTGVSAPYQKHHILPRAYFKLCKTPVDNTETNLVCLTYTQHILAHYYLCLCVKPSALEKALLFAFISMTHEFPHTFDIQKLPEYGKLYESWCIRNRELAKTRTRMPLTEPTKAKIAAKAKSRYAGHIWVNKDGIRKHVDPIEIPALLAQGFQLGRGDPETAQKISEAQRAHPNRSMLGRTQSAYQRQRVSESLKGKHKDQKTCSKFREAHANKILVSNDETQESHYIQPDLLQSFLEKGFHRGRRKK